MGIPSSAAAQTLPAGWTNADIGTPLIRGSAQAAADTFTVTGAGGGIGGPADGFHFAYRPISGDADVSVFVKSFQTTNPLAQAGLMIRESLSPDADYAYVFASGGQQVGFQMRSVGGLRLTSIPSGTSGMWIRLVRQGHSFRAYNSPDGSEWTLFAFNSDYMIGTVYLGLAVSSHDESQTATASFVSTAFGDAPLALPAPWAATDVGSPFFAGASSAANGTFTVKGAGLGIGGTGDEFQFLYQAVTGDMEVVASVDSLLAVDGRSKGGLMIREAFTVGAASAGVFATGAQGWEFQRRLSAGAWALSTVDGIGKAPGWVRLVRQGDVFTAYLSPDGAVWQVFDSETISMPATVYVGLAVSSQDASGIATGTFSNVAVRAIAANQPPSVTISSPLNGATFQAPGVVTISATAADPDGSIARVDFYVGSSLIGSDSTSPFSITWNVGAAASATLRAVATDDRGATTSSAPVTITSAAAQTLPAGWTNADIGTPLIRGSAQAAADTFTVTGAGGGIGGPADGFHFAYRPISGDADVSVFVKSFQTTNPLAQAGLMIRESLSPDADYAYVFASGGQQVGFQMRSVGGLRLTSIPSGTSGMWIRLVRQGHSFRAYNSPDGSEWTLFAFNSDYMIGTVYLGLAVSSHDESQTATASFVSTAFGDAPLALPAPWAATDVGSPFFAGASSAANGTFTVKGAGLGIGGTGDEFQFLYQAVTGDMEVVASVDSLLAVDGRSKGGLMIREAFTVGAASAGVFATGAQGWEFQRRLSAGAWALSTVDGIGKAPGWVRLVRQGDVFTAYLSPDGAVWQVFDSETISMPATVYVGLAVSSQDASGIATGTFSNVAVRAIAANQPPSVTISSPLNGATFQAPGVVTISATAADPDGSIARVDFYVGSSLIGSDSTSPFSITWNVGAAASATLRAVATDDRGATTSSAPVTITSADAPDAPDAPEAVPLTKLAFVAPPDYSSNVTSMTVELRRSTDPTSAAPSASLGIGKPAIVDGEITVDITGLIVPLPQGSYYAIVVAFGPGGSAWSTPSPTFSR